MNGQQAAKALYGGSSWSTSEHKEQEGIVKWASYKQNTIPELALLFHVPNGGNRSAKSGGRMKKLGAQAGVPDLCLPVMRKKPGGGMWGALWIEMKSDSGKLRKSQREWRDRLQEAGHAHAVCRSWVEARSIIMKYLNGKLEDS